MNCAGVGVGNGGIRMLAPDVTSVSPKAGDLPAGKRLWAAVQLSSADWRKTIGRKCRCSNKPTTMPAMVPLKRERQQPKFSRCMTQPCEAIKEKKSK
jgi:hypothetical protein